MVNRKIIWVSLISVLFIGSLTLDRTPTDFVRDFDLPVNGNFMDTVKLVDKDQNRIADDLELKLINSDQSKLVDSLIMMKNHDFASDFDLFNIQGIDFLSKWDSPHSLVYGGRAMLSASQINYLAKYATDNLVLIEENKQLELYSDVTTKITGIRPYIWDTLGYTGDIPMSIALLDSGIDPTHTVMAPGYANGNFANKIVGWTDVTSENANSPEDAIGHGSHLAGIIAGNEYNNSDSNGLMVQTLDLSFTTSADSNYTYFIYIDQLGPVNFDFYWERQGGGSPSSTLTTGIAIHIYDDDNNHVTSASAVQAASGTVSVGTQVNSTSEFGMWRVDLEYRVDTGRTMVVETANRLTFPNGTDGHDRFSGVGPDLHLVGVKVVDSNGVGTSADAIQGLEWVNTNKQTYSITTALMSFGFDSVIALLDEAAQNLFNAGVLVIAAAGNDGQIGGNQINSPGHLDVVLTVGASDDSNSVTTYSSSGPGANSNTTKPDIVAPGGDMSTGGIIQMDSNLNLLGGTVSDNFQNTMKALNGTSLSAAFVAGVAGLVVEALGGMSQWQYGSSVSPELVKSILLMTAKEINTDNNHGKDSIEGFGIINPVAAVEAASKRITFGNNEVGTLGVNQHVWARNMSLQAGGSYNLDLSYSGGADLDLFVYGSSNNSVGDPTLIQQSTNGGATDSITFTAGTTGIYFVVIRSAFGTSGSTSFTLSSSTDGGVDITPPTISHPNNIRYPFGTTGHLISWDLFDFNPGVYNITLNGTEVVTNQTWTNGQVDYNIDGLSLGDHEFNIIVYDSNDNLANDTVQVSVVDDQVAPVITSPPLTTYPEGSTGNTITWTIDEEFPDSYWVYEDGIATVNGSVTSNSVTINIDGLVFGDHNFTVFVNDTSNNIANSTAFVQVVEPDTTAPTLSSGGDITFKEGETGNSINWTVSDDFPGVYDLFRNETEIESNVAWTSGIIEISVDGLTEGVYIFKIDLFDSSGNLASNSITVTVLNANVTVSTPPPDGGDDDPGLSGGAVAGIIIGGAVLAGAAGAGVLYKKDPEGFKDRVGNVGDKARSAGSSMSSRMSGLRESVSNRFSSSESTGDTPSTSELSRPSNEELGAAGAAGAATSKAKKKSTTKTTKTGPKGKTPK